MIKVKFMRYTANGADEATIDVPSESVWLKAEGYSHFPLTKRNRVWESKGVLKEWGNHAIGLMLKDEDFVRSYVPTWAVKGLRKYTSNLYVFFYNGEDGGDTTEPTKEPTAKTKKHKAKKERKPRVKKVNPEKEKKLTFKALRNKLNGKIKLTKALHHWTDPAKLQYFGSQHQTEKDNFDKVVVNIFKSYKSFVDELLTSRNVPFYVAAENYDVQDSVGPGNLSVEYVLLNNTENVPIPTLEKQNFKKLVLTWFSTTKVINRDDRWSRSYEKYLSIKKIGLAEGSRHVRKSDVRSFKSMRESVFTELITKTLEANTAAYNGKVEEFRAMKTRVVTNKVEEKKLGDFIASDIIPHVDAAYLSGNACDFEENFRINFTERGSYSNLEILNIGTEVDDVEKLTIQVEFFDHKRVHVSTADEAIKVIKNVFPNMDEFKSMMETFKRAWNAK